MDTPGPEITALEPDKTRSDSDNLCKQLAETYPEQFIEWLFGVKVGQARILKTELAREPIRADAAIILESEDEVFHIEFQTTPKSHIPLPLRMLDYYVGFKRKFLDRRIRQILVVLKDTGEEIPDRHDGEGWFYRYETVKMWEQDPRELLKHEGLLAFAVLCRAGRTERKNGRLLRQVAKKIREIDDPEKQRETLRMAQVFAGLRYAQEIIYQVLRGGDMLEESVIVQDWMQRGMQKGVQKGLEQGLAQGMAQGKEDGERQLVLRQLARRLGRLPAQTKKRIESLRLRQVEKLSFALLDFKDKAELNEWLAKHSR